MAEIHTYPKMNAKIKDLLRIGEQPICLYAAKRIEELEEYERKKGKWEFREEFFAYGIAHFDCSICGESVLERTRFCPNCGADMRGEDDG